MTKANKTAPAHMGGEAPEPRRITKMLLALVLVPILLFSLAASCSDTASTIVDAEKSVEIIKGNKDILPNEIADLGDNMLTNGYTKAWLMAVGDNNAFSVEIYKQSYYEPGRSIDIAKYITKLTGGPGLIKTEDETKTVYRYLTFTGSYKNKKYEIYVQHNQDQCIIEVSSR